MSDLPPARTAQRRDFPNGERREVVVHQEALVGLAFQPIHPLDVIGGSQRCRNQSLRLSTREYSRTVRSRKQTGFDPDGTDRIEFAFVWAFALVQNLIAEDSFLQRVKDTLYHLERFFIGFREQLDGFFLRRIDKRVAFKLRVFVSIQGIFEFGPNRLFHFLGDSFVD